MRLLVSCRHAVQESDQVSNHSRKRRYRHRRRRREIIARLFDACKAIGPGMTRAIIASVFDRKVGAICLPSGWRIDYWLSPGVLAVQKADPFSFMQYAKPSPFDTTFGGPP